MNFLLQFATVDPSETELRARFAKLGIGAGKNFDASKLPPDIQEALQDGMADAWKEFEEFKKTEIDTGKRPAAEAFGTRDYLKNDYMARMTGAALGIYGNSKQEALYPAYFTDAAGEVQSVDPGSGQRAADVTCGPQVWQVFCLPLPARVGTTSRRRTDREASR